MNSRTLEFNTKITIMIVSIFNNYSSSKSFKTINIWDWLLNEDEILKSIVFKIRTTANQSERKGLKSKLPAITPSGLFRERRANMLEQHSGLICIDIDGKENLDISDWEEVKIRLSKLPFIMYAGLSVGGAGIFVLIKLAYPENHLQQFTALYETFKQLNINIDESCSDICRLRGYSYDAKPYINPNSSLYYGIAEKNVSKSISSKEYVDSTTSSNQNLTIQKNMQIQTAEEYADFFINPPIIENEMQFRPLLINIDELIQRVLETKTDITASYKDWFSICCILANRFGEKGRERFHELSRFYPKYTRKECDLKFSECLTRQYFYKSDLLFEIAKRYGL